MEAPTYPEKLNAFVATLDELNRVMEGENKDTSLLDRMDSIGEPLLDDLRSLTRTGWDRLSAAKIAFEKGQITVLQLFREMETLHRAEGALAIAFAIMEHQKSNAV